MLTLLFLMTFNTKKPRATLTINKGCADTNLSAHPFERYIKFND
ncbi:hypothetical protein [Prevotella sp. HJM029]|nr:hypothetical protein [Prevotella sp. HJM029]